MTTPNFIPGMKLKGIGRRSKEPHFKKSARKWLQYQAQQLKASKEAVQQQRNNLPYKE